MKSYFLGIKKYIVKLFIRITRHSFIAAIFLFLISLAIGSLLFYKYNVVLPQRIISELENPILFRESSYQKVLDYLEKQRQDFLKAENKEYPDIFDIPIKEQKDDSTD